MMTKYMIGEAGCQRFLGVSIKDEVAVTAALDAAAIRYEKPQNSLTVQSPLCVLFDFGADCNCSAIQLALDTVVRTPMEVKPIRPMSFRQQK